MTAEERQQVRKALKKAQQVTAAELAVRVDSFCGFNAATGKFDDESSLGHSEMDLLRECRVALAKIAEALGVVG